MIPALSPMNPLDAEVPFTFDFSNLLAAGDSIAEVVEVTSAPEGLAIGTPTVIDGAKAGCAVQCTLGEGTTGVTYLVTAEIRAASGTQLARTVSVPVGLV